VVLNCAKGCHRISIDHHVLGPTCGLLPVGIASTVLTTSGLRWNLGKLKLSTLCVSLIARLLEDETESSFDGLVSTSNHLVPEEQFVTIKTSRPIWWCAELRNKT
jgi:thiamine pyrophosphokinase